MEGLTIYKSSAGSGKTFTLVLEYIKLLIPNPYRYRNILAITFTNKATDEMKRRILQALGRLATLPSAELAQDGQYRLLREHLQAQGQGEVDVQANARLALSLILNDYGNFSVSTIESFMQRVIRSFTRELNIQLGFEVEMKQDVVLERMVDELLAEVGQPSTREVTRLLEGFVDRKLEEEKSWQVGHDIKQLGRELFQEQFQQLLVSHPQQNKIEQTLALDKALWAIRRGFEQRMQRIAERARSLMEEEGLSVEDFMRKAIGPMGYLLRMIDPEKPEAYVPNRYAYQAYEEPEKWATKRAPRREAVEVAVARGLGDLLAEAIHQYEAGWQAYQSAVQVLQSLHSFGLVHELERLLKNYRKENNQLLISDTNFLLGNLIQGQDVPFVFEKVGTRYQHYLLDEFQDTSDMQWRNLFPLLEDSLAQGQGSLLVGDVKQSIYRWRNGNMRLLMEGVEQQVGERGQGIRLQELRQNWRTAPDIVRFNNALFRLLAQHLSEQFEAQGWEALFEKAYASVEQQARKTELPGQVEVSFFPGKARTDPPDTPSWEELAQERCLEIIRSLLDHGFRGNEIALLLRRNSEGIRLAEYLQKAGISVSSSESLLVANHPTVMFLAAVLRYLNNEGDQVARAAVGRFHALLEKQVLGHEQLARLLAGEDAWLADRDALRRMPVYECVEALLDRFPALKTTANAYLHGFLEAVYQFSVTEDASLSGFLAWWETERKKLAVAGSTDAHAVQVMTIHKAKGLEFPVVILPFADWPMGTNHRDILWVPAPDASPYEAFPFIPVHPSKKLADTYFRLPYLQEEVMSYLDNLNLLYVACTRPKYRLYVLTKQHTAKSTSSFSSVHKLLHEFVPKLPLPLEEVSPQRWTLGTAAGKEQLLRLSGEAAPASEEEETIAPGWDTFTSWNEAIKIRYSSNRFVGLDIQERQERISVGELLHEALASVKTHDDLPRAVEQLVLKGYLQADQRAWMQQQLLRITSLSAVADWYEGSWQVRNEADIILEGGQVLRPDRVMLREGRAVVVDYKSGKASDRYARQLRTYMGALKQMGYEQVEGYLYYLNLEKVQQIE